MNLRSPNDARECERENGRTSKIYFNRDKTGLAVLFFCCGWSQVNQFFLNKIHIHCKYNNFSASVRRHIKTKHALVEINMRILLIQCLTIFLICEVTSSSPNRHKRDVTTCGNSIRSTSLIAGGTSFPSGAFPWVVALNYTKNKQTHFFCSGTLISSRHVITGKNPGTWCCLLM